MRRPGLARRAAQVTADRGAPPRLALVAFAPGGERPQFVGRKVRACEAVGVQAEAVVLSDSVATDRVRDEVRRLARRDFDGIFLEFPFPPDVDADEVMTAVPERLDVDVMTPGRTRRFLEKGVGPPPVTVEAAHTLLEAHDLDVHGLEGVVVADDSPFAEMFRAAFARRGARMRPLVPPDAARSGVADAELVIAAAARAGLIPSSVLREGAIAIDAGYFNPGGRGDIDTSPGIGHLRALAPVPGAIGPMTVSVLVQRVIEFAAGATEASRDDD